MFKNIFNKSNFNYKILKKSNYIIGSYLLGLSGLYFYNKNKNETIKKISWIELRDKIKNENNLIQKIELYDNKYAKVLEKNINKNNIYVLNICDSKDMENKIEKINPNINIQHIHKSILENLLITLAPTLLIFGGIYYFYRKNQGNMLSFMKKDFKLVREKPKIKLEEVAGLHQIKSDVLEFANIILKPEKYLELGAKIPQGILLEGLPGTGKTMLAKAIANNYDCNFYLINGSDFIQPVIGTGSRKIKELFDEVRNNSPAIIFIDELDAIGKSRGNGKSIGNEERDNILNSLLVEMDGFNDNKNILVMAATNRAEILDPALLRPGRFDRKINFNLPNRLERKDILSMYYNKYKICENVEKSDIIEKLSYNTFGFSGADIQNLFNEAAIITVRDHKNSIDERSLNDSIDYIRLGNEKKSLQLSTKERETVAVHEAGHALVSNMLENVPNAIKVSIIPRTKGMLGFSESKIQEEKTLYYKEEFIDQIKVLMAGRAAEEVLLNSISSGARDDIQRINKLLKQMINDYGMSDTLGLLNLNLDNNNFYNINSNNLHNLSDSECLDVLHLYYLEVKDLLEKNKNKLIKIKDLLLQNDTILEEDIQNIF